MPTYFLKFFIPKLGFLYKPFYFSVWEPNGFLAVCVNYVKCCLLKSVNLEEVLINFPEYLFSSPFVVGPF